MHAEIGVTPVAHYTDMAGNSGKDKVFAYFHDVIDEDPHETKKQGRPIARSRVFLCKQFPGTTDKIDRPVKEKDKHEFAQQWAQYEAKQTQTITGTALEMWPLISRTTVYELKALGVHTVEQLLAIPDAVKHRIMGYQQLATKAQAFLDMTVKPKLLEEEREGRAKATEQLNEALASNKALEAQVAELRDLVTKMAAQQAAAQAAVPAVQEAKRR